MKTFNFIYGIALNELPSNLGIKQGDILGYLEVPSIKLNLPIYFGTDPNTLTKGIGMLEGTSFPVGGESTHSVLAAHTGLTNQKLFTDIDKLKKGDIFFIHIFKKKMAYKVNQIKVVHPDQIDELKIIKGKDYVTLLTCYPYGINTERLLVRGERTDITPQIEKEIEVAQKNTNIFAHTNKKLIIIIILLLIILLLIVVSFIKIKFANSKK
ncbi:class C sortase [Clostridium sp. B9]|uniref:class C sortase n=1 Tax=Clostridium sp. B9 TaxID=3423224 RepID=UPI003D2F49B2